MAHRRRLDRRKARVRPMSFTVNADEEEIIYAAFKGAPQPSLSAFLRETVLRALETPDGEETDA